MITILDDILEALFFDSFQSHRGGTQNVQGNDAQGSNVSDDEGQSEEIKSYHTCSQETILPRMVSVVGFLR